jgi:hypothetical protein
VEAPSPSSLAVRQREAFINRELPRKVRKALETAIEKNFGPFEETLKSELENIVRDCHETLTRSFIELSRPSIPSHGITVSAAAVLGSEVQDEPTKEPSPGLSPYRLPTECMMESWQGVLDTLSVPLQPYLLDPASQSYWCDSPNMSLSEPSLMALSSGQHDEAYSSRQGLYPPDVQYQNFIDHHQTQQ